MSHLLQTANIHWLRFTASLQFIYVSRMSVWRMWPMSSQSLTFHSALNMLKRGLLLAAPQFFPQPLDGKVADIIAHVGFSLCAQSMHRLQGLCTLPHVPLLCFHSSRCLAVTCAQNDVMGTACLWQLHLTCFIFVQATVTRKAVRVNTSSPA